MDDMSHVDNLIALEDHCFNTFSDTFSISSIRVLFENALALPSSSRGKWVIAATMHRGARCCGFG